MYTGGVCIFIYTRFFSIEINRYMSGSLMPSDWWFSAEKL